MLGNTKKKLKRTRNMDAHIQLMRIAENCEESVFQKNEEYLKFKAQKNISTLDMEIFIGRLYTLDYPEEKIYWNKRALEEKVGDKETRYPFFYNLVCAYSKLKEFELVLEYGRTPFSWLDSLKEKLEADTKYYLILCLRTASKKLERFEESIVYEKERLKLIVKTYNSGGSVMYEKTPITKLNILQCYQGLIESQIRCKHFEDALKTFKKIKLFKLDSTDSDVEDSMADFVGKSDAMERCNYFSVIADLCCLKSQVFYGLGDKHNGSLWSSLSIDTCVNLHEMTRSFVQNDASASQKVKQISYQEIFTTQLVNTALNIAEIDPSQRRELFNKTMCYLLYESKHASFYLSELARHDFMNFETLIPFIEHFIKRCTKDVLAKVKKRLEHIKYKKKIDPNFCLKNQRKQMVTYQNSLLIMKHFNGLP